MQLHHVDFSFALLTPCFSGTALGKHAAEAEMRIPPIRGHVRFWHQQLFGVESVNRVWGCANRGEGQSSQLALLFANPPSRKQASPKPALLPHKESKHEHGPRSALAAEESFMLRLQRLVGCGQPDWDQGQKAVKLWLLLGCLGLRANRAAGSIWPKAEWTPRTPASFASTLINLGLNTWSVALAGCGAGLSPDDLRQTASDTIQDSPEIFGAIKPKRIPSPTRFKVVEFDSGPCLLAIAPRLPIQGRTLLRQAEHLLRDKPKPERWRQLGDWDHVIP